jgi:hypothetical protein
MKLKLITENELSGSRTIIQDTAKIVESLIQYIYTLDDQSLERRTLDAFMSKPTPENWRKSNWLIDSAIRKSDNPEGVQNSWKSLKTLTPEVVVASFYDLDPRTTRGTPFQNITLNSKKRKDLKAALGPQGYVSTTSKLGDLRSTDAHDMLKKTADNKDNLDKAIEKDLPNNVRKIERF